MTISQADLPREDSGILPAGMWRVVLRDPITDGFAQMSFEQGVSAPMNGRSLWRLVIGMPVIGAMRVEGEPCEIGDCSRLKPQVDFEKLEQMLPKHASDKTDLLMQAKLKAKYEAIAEERGTAEAAAKQTAVVSSWRDLVAMSEDKVRALAAELGNEDQRARVGKLRRFIADELGIEVEQ